MENILDRQEILRYLNAAGSGEALYSLVDRAEREVIAASRPKHVHKHVLLETEPQEGWTVIGGEKIESRNLAYHLRGCHEGFLLACTLGPGVDTLVKRYSITDVAMLPVVQAVAAAYTEYCIEKAQEELEQYAKSRRLFLRPRYSPGYGDFPLRWQVFLFEALEITKKIGVALTESYLMVPFKSVTAVIGLSLDPNLCHINRCMICSEKNCPFRKEALKND